MTDDDIQEQMADALRELEQETAVWIEQNIPPPGQVFMLGENQFMTHVHLRALDRVVREALGSDLVELAIKQEFVKVMRETRAVVKEARKQELRKSIVDGVNIVRPKPEI